jgi:hypothetical protein
MLPITEYCQLIQLADSEDVDTAVNNFGISIEEEDRIFLCDEDFSRPVQRIEGGKCLRFASCNRFYPHVETESIQKARLYLVAHGLEMSGDIYVGGMSIPDGEEQEQIIFMPYRKKSL